MASDQKYTLELTVPQASLLVMALACSRTFNNGLEIVDDGLGGVPKYRIRRTDASILSTTNQVLAAINNKTVLEFGFDLDTFSRDQIRDLMSWVQANG